MLSEFELYRPTTLQEASELKEQGGVIVAGGTDVFVSMHGANLRPGELVDIKGIESMGQVAFDENAGLTLGALTTHRTIEEWDIIKERFCALFEGCSQVGSVQIRNRGTLGGNICNAAPSADSVGPLLVLGAQCVIVGQNGRRQVPLSDFFTGPKQTVLKADELLYQIVVPTPCLNSGSAYIKYTRRRAMDLALLGVSIYLALEEGKISEVRIALATAAPTPIRIFGVEAMLQGQDAHALASAEISKLVALEANPRSSWRASREFRLALIEELFKRAYFMALARAEGGRV